MSAAGSRPSPSFADLGAEWQQPLQAWAGWWQGGGRVPGSDGAGRALRIPQAPFDIDAVAALQASFLPRIERLWEAAHAAVRSGAPIPQLVVEAGNDRRFASAAWRDQPYFAWLKQAYLLYGEYLAALASLAVLPPTEKRQLEFSVRQFIDAIAPTNFPATNPDVLERAIATEGASVIDGFRNLMADLPKGRISLSDESAFDVGRNVAITPGSVVFRNPLIELIQYDAATPRVARRPLLMVPPCINKYYILDLTPANSFVRHAVLQGHTVFMISWRNIPRELGHLKWDDYLEQGVFAALKAVKAITRSRQANTLGFCVGGTLLACALAVLGARSDDSVASVTLLTTMLDFADPGDIGVYVTRDALARRESALLAGQRVHGRELAGAFASLRPNDLVWNYVVNSYLKGRKPPPFDLLYWNGDSANLPGPMYAYFIGRMYLENRLREPGSLEMLGTKVNLSMIRAPAYVFASRDDHIVPWRSAHRAVDLIGSTSTFVLGASGHVAGVINPPESKRRDYWTGERSAATADDWLASAGSHPGSWWPHWYRWLADHAGGRKNAPRRTGSAAFPSLGKAPGTYVNEPVD